jgi:epoxyqueuosine reductase
MSNKQPKHVPQAPAIHSCPDQTLSEMLKAFLKDKGADLVGIGSVQRLAGAPEAMQPTRYLPDAHALISIGLRINEAVCDLIARSVRDRTVPASYHSYQLFTLTIVNPQLDTLAYEGAKFLEARGYRAYPFPANMPHELRPSAEYPGGPGDISHRHVAVACGLGQIGWHSMLVTPQFGARQKLTTIVTNAPLLSDAMFEEELCIPSRCGFQCARACPTAAIPATLDEKVSISIGDHRTQYAKIVGWKCRWGCSGMLKCTGGYKDIPMPGAEPAPDELLRYKAEADPWQERVRRYSGLLPYCGRCLCVCRKPSPGSACSRV